MSLLELNTSIIEGNSDRARELTRRALDEGVSPEEIVNGWMEAMNEVGQRFERGEAFIPELIVAGRTLQQCLELLAPERCGLGLGHTGRVVLGTVKGDIHDIGKNLVAMMLRGAGFRVIDLGIDVPPEQFVQAVLEHQPEIVGMSALLTTTMLEMPKVLDSFKSVGVRERIRVMVGGAPVNQEFAEKIGADGYARDAFAAVALAKRLLA